MGLLGPRSMEDLIGYESGRGDIDIMPKACHGKADAEVKSLIVTAVQSEKSRSEWAKSLVR